MRKQAVGAAMLLTAGGALVFGIIYGVILAIGLIPTLCTGAAVAWIVTAIILLGSE